jgi:hypothetical protein
MLGKTSPVSLYRASCSIHSTNSTASVTFGGIKAQDTEAAIENNNEITTGGTSLHDNSALSSSLPILSRKGARILVKRYVLVLGSLHLTLMAILGVWLWSDLHLFGLGNRKRADFKAANELTLERATIAILGQGVPLSSSALRIASIAIYSLFLVPGLNLIPPMILFLAVYFGCRHISFAKKWDVLPAYIGLGILLAINLVFIVDIELTRNMNTILQSDEEADWGFGQILAILLLLLPLRDLIEALLERRLKQRQKELDQDLRDAIGREDFDQVKRAIERGSSFPSPKSRGMSCLAIVVLKLNTRQMSTSDSGASYYRRMTGPLNTLTTSAAPG